MVIDYGGGTPAVDFAASLAPAFIKRIKAVESTGGPGLTPLALRLTDGGDLQSDLLQTNEGYLAIDGVALPDFGSDASSPPARSPDKYGVDQVVSGSVDYAARVTRYAGAQAASAALRDLAATIAAKTGYVDVAPVDGGSTLGDESIELAYGYQTGGTTSRGVLVAMRAGNLVATVQVDAAPTSAPHALVEALARAQAACLRDGGVCPAVEAPAALRALASPRLRARPPADQLDRFANRWRESGEILLSASSGPSMSRRVSPMLLRRPRLAVRG